jgi:hypothetical protein
MREEEGSCAVRSESDGSIPLRPAGPWAGRGFWAGLAGVCHSGPLFFFSANQFSFLQNACKVHKCVEIILGIQNLYFKFL